MFYTEFVDTVNNNHNWYLYVMKVHLYIGGPFFLIYDCKYAFNERFVIPVEFSHILALSAVNHSRCLGGF